MRIAPSFIKTVIKPTQKSLQEFVRSLHTTYQNFSEAFNGRVSYGDGTNTENIDGSWASVTTPTPAGTNFTVTHGLNRTPVGVHVMQKNAFCDVLIVSSTSTQITLQASAAGAVIKLFIFLLFFCLIPFSSSAQGVRHVNIAQGQVKLAGSSGFSGNVSTPLAGATITVCTGSTLPASGAACTGLASIYVDIGLTGLLSNPTNSDSGGNYSFYAVGGVPYVVSVSAVGFTTFSYVWSAPLSGTSPTLTGTTTVVNLTVSGTATTLNLNDILWVGAGSGSYNTVAAAVTAAGSVNKTIIAIRSTFVGTCPAATLSTTNPNITIWDFSGTCNPTTPSAAYNGTTYNFFDGNVQAQNRCGYSPNAMPATASSAILCHYFITAPINLTVGTGNTVDGISAECDLFGTLTGTLPNCQAAEHDWTIATTGGTVTWVTAGMFYGGNTSTSTTAITNAAGVRTLGCKTGSILGVQPTNCYGIFADDQRANASGRNFSVFGVGKIGVGYSPSQGIGGIYFEDHLNALHLANIYVDSTDALQIGALTSAGLFLQDSGLNNQFGVTSTGGRIFKALAFNETTAPSGVSGQDVCYGDSTAHALKCSMNNGPFTPIVGLFTSVNVTPVTTSGGSTTNDQNAMAITITAGALNSVSRTLLIQLAGVYSTPAASTTTLTHKIKLCTVSGCGSGTVLVLTSWTSSALGGVQATNNPYNVTINSSTQTAGASAAFEVHGNLTIDLAALASAAEAVFADNNTATVGTIDSTAQLFLQHTVAFSAASASNLATDRQMIADTVD